MLEQKVANCCIQRTEAINLKKRNRIKMPNQLKNVLTRYDTKD